MVVMGGIIIGIFSFITCTCHLPSVYKAYFVFVSSVSQRLQRVFEFCNENIAVKNKNCLWCSNKYGGSLLWS